MAEPAGVLGEIAAAKRRELAVRYDGVALDALRARARPARRSLVGALARKGARFILEIKKTSPSEGVIRAAADPAAMARGYAGVADALSVLCDRAYFGGSLDDLAAARVEFDGPILAKDFFTDLRQVAEARIAGADAVLVMLSLLDDDAARAMIAEARGFGMDALVEVHDEAEMRRALALGAPLIGINNRDLRDLSIDLATTERLAPLAPDRILVSESGIAKRGDVSRLSPLVDGFLVGSSLMRADEPAQAAGTYLRTHQIVRIEQRRRPERRPASGLRRLRVRAWQPPPCHCTGSRTAGRCRAEVGHAARRGVSRCAAAHRVRHRHFAEPPCRSAAWP